ncbi:WD40 repeat domain-containing protein [Nostoc sp. TCL26-01]|uniref:WD40 repeat domain-containing protein n=1 Tax=Nostoc sp. TCL26-01 TaxID=2576904 RepID=UPI0015BC24B7|nr:WD40 repeat domain-containing protein [Nostoc sp. TCL26-01]QLE59664.1 WD40 repeat domain-containing protein [Nostoc sp. TCL26-01]
MPDSQDPKQVNNNDLSNAQFGGGFINAESVNAGQIGGDVYNIYLGKPILDNPKSSPSQKQQAHKESKSSETQYSSDTLGQECEIGKYSLNGHSGAIQSVAISPDGRLLASASSDTTVKLWDLSNRKLLFSMNSHSTVTRAVAFSLDGQTLASSSNVDVQDGNIKLWDVSTGSLKRIIGGGVSTFRVNCLAFSLDGKVLASGQVNTVKLWNWQTGEEIRTLWGHAIDVNTVVFTPDGKHLVAGCSQGDIKIWEWQTGNLLRTLNQTSDLFGVIASFILQGLWWVTVSPDGQLIASCGYGQPINIWNFNTGKIISTLNHQSGGVHYVAFSPDGQVLASGGQDKTIKFWNVKNGDLLYSFEHQDAVNCLAFSQNGKLLASGGEDKAIRIWTTSF